MLFRASAVGSHTTLSRIIRMVRQAQSSKPEIGQLADKISAVFVPVVVIALVSAAPVLLWSGTANCLYPGDCHHGTDYRLSVCAGAGDAVDVDYFRRVGRAAEFGVLVWTPTRCNAPVHSIPSCSIKPGR